MEGEKKTRANAPCLELRQRKDRAWVVSLQWEVLHLCEIQGHSNSIPEGETIVGALKKSRAGSKKVSLRLVSVSSVQSLSRVRLFVTPWTTARQASLSITNSQNLLKLMSFELVMPSNHLILCHSLLLPPSIFLSIRVFCNQLVLCIRWPKYWSFSFSISPSNEYSGLISFRIDWLDLLAVQGTLKSLLQHYRSKAWILQRSAFPAHGLGKVGFPVRERAFLPVLQSLHLNSSWQMKAEMLLSPAIVSQDAYLILSLPCL